MSFFFMLVAVLPWLLVFAAMVWFTNRIRPSREDRLHADDLRELKEQVALTRDFLRDAMERIRRLEAAVGPERLGPGSGGPDAAPGDGAEPGELSGPRNAP